ncbi:hypothetical protein NG791_08500 [Laspinema sp. D1]|uniref:hypothetical protein n=1 Tax=Laspinema palackyanum TaxID=3231601 RepID=UPI0034946802|nr:hypothetical protein [Laspinema sp. D2b]
MMPNPLPGLIVLRAIAAAVYIAYGYHRAEGPLEFTGCFLVALDSVLLIVAYLIQ